MYYRQAILFAAMVALLYKLDKSANRRETLLRAVFLTLTYFLFHQLVMGVEGFLFEVTPWKKTCLLDREHRSPKCCAAGYNGQPIGFEYTGDHDRMEMMRAGCSCCRPHTKNRVTNYASLGDCGQVQEGYTLSNAPGYCERGPAYDYTQINKICPYDQ